MKNTWKLITTAVILWLFWTIPSLADPPEPPPPPASHGQNGNAPAGAPIDGGLGILLALGATYGGRKVWKTYQKGRRTTYPPAP